MSKKNEKAKGERMERLGIKEAAVRLRLEQNWISTASIVILAAVAMGVTLKFASSVLIPFTLALFIKQIVKPLIDFQIDRMNMPNMVAIFITLIIVLLVFSGACIFLVNTVGTIAGKAVDYNEKFIGMLEMAQAKMAESGIEIKSEQVISELKKRAPSFISTSFGTLFGFVTSSFLVAIFLIFLLVGYNPKQRLRGLYGEVSGQVSKYISIKLALSAATGVLVWMVLSICHLELASFFGVLTFMLNFIPSIGSIIATFLPLPIALAQYDNPIMVIVVILVPGIIQMVIGNIIDPKMMGKGLSLHPVTVLLALSFWGLIWGVPGMLLAAPMTATIRIVMMRFETLRPMAMVMAGEFPEMDSSGEH